MGKTGPGIGHLREACKYKDPLGCYLAESLEKSAAPSAADKPGAPEKPKAPEKSKAPEKPKATEKPKPPGKN